MRITKKDITESIGLSVAGLFALYATIFIIRLFLYDDGSLNFVPYIISSWWLGYVIVLSVVYILFEITMLITKRQLGGYRIKTFADFLDGNTMSFILLIFFGVAPLLIYVILIDIEWMSERIVWLIANWNRLMTNGTTSFFLVLGIGIIGAGSILLIKYILYRLFIQVKK